MRRRSQRSRMLVTPRDAKLLVRYLDAVDDAVSARLAIGFNPHEEHLTALLCEMLDDNWSSNNNLSYPVTQLRIDLAEDAKELSIVLRIEANRFPPQVERKVTYADLGIVVAYRDHDAPNNSFERAVVLQAKKLYPELGSPSYSMYNEFGAFDSGQLGKLAALNKILGEPLCNYLFYCPSAAAYDESSRAAFHRSLIQGGDIYDFTPG